MSSILLLTNDYISRSSYRRHLQTCEALRLRASSSKHITHPFPLVSRSSSLISPIATLDYSTRKPCPRLSRATQSRSNTLHSQPRTRPHRPSPLLFRLLVSIITHLPTYSSYLRSRPAFSPSHVTPATLTKSGGAQSACLDRRMGARASSEGAFV